MQPTLQKKFNQLEKTKKQIVTLVTAVDERTLHTSFNNKWSIGQILAHIVTSERLALIYMRKKALGIDKLKDSGMMESVKTLLLKISQRLPLKFKAPNDIRDKTPQQLTKADLLSTWDASREDLRKFLSTIEEKHVRRLIFKHPIAGMLDAAQGVAFLREHIIHHRPQISRLLRKAKANR